MPVMKQYLYLFGKCTGKIERLILVLLVSLHYAKSLLTRVFSRSILVPCVPFSMLGGPEKLLLKTQVSKDFA
jgi:hypothetical protein